ncbi:DUF6259 domain-containing protein [Eubacteriales bacterium OttesenSCG-928-G02]|nr:DUF6259 domain-containing protein [Eubacteriales bacterium OttesenSCG-928-G02]
MYSSRKFLENDQINIAFDSVSGEIISIFTKEFKDNIIKNAMHGVPNLFCIMFGNNKLTMPNKPQIDQYPELKPRIDIKNNVCLITLNKLFDSINFYNVDITIKIELDENKIKYSMQLKKFEDAVIDFIEFPCINGLILGETYKDNSIIMPFNAGQKFDNPVNYFEKPISHINWRWQDYRTTYNYDGLSAHMDETGFYNHGAYFTGPLSMAFTDLYNKKYGIYFGKNNNTDGINALILRTKGTKCLGMSLTFKHMIANNNVDLTGYSLEFHEGDWHKGADIYANYKKREKIYETAEWFKNSNHLMAHYDFQYQNREIVHTFKDIPSLVDEAVQQGSKHMLFAGWHNEGFDYGFPDFRLNPLLGTEEELKSGFDYAHKNNVRISFYLNTRMSNVNVKMSEELIKTSAAIDKNGNKYIEHAGDKSIDFVLMCPSSKGWQNHLFESVKALSEIGLDGVYYDQLCMAPPRMCFDESHGHKPFDWMKGYVELLKKTNGLKTWAGEKFNVIIEGCSEYYVPYADGMLVSTFVNLNSGSEPNIFRYTYPQQTLVDMVYPRYGNAMRPEHVGAKSTHLIHTAFLNNLYFWQYDLYEDNTFKTDPEQGEYVKEITLFKENLLQVLQQYTFADNRYILETSEGTDAKIYINKDKAILLFTNTSEEKEIVLNKKVKIEKILTQNINNNFYKDNYIDGKTIITLPDVKYGAIFINIID